MLYVHSFSQIEQQLFRKLSFNEPINQIDLLQIQNKEDLIEQCKFINNTTLLYSFQRLGFYTHIDSFKHECDVVDWLMEYVLENHFEKLILLTYPGAYYNSSNLFLQHKGIIEQKFTQSGIHCTLLNVQAIGDKAHHYNNLHELFFEKTEGHYVIPKKSQFYVYSIAINNLVEIISKSVRHKYSGKYDAFDTVIDIKSFLLYYSRVLMVSRVSPVYLYFKSFFGTYPSPTMLELFLLTMVPMYKFRTEKEFHLMLDAVEITSPEGVYSSNSIHLNHIEPSGYQIQLQG
ncbi:MAG: hypothetical protein IPI46_10815 [Bacteroidetes bacterium]|nr:hypothetical protein [Bacteroidota bacterium]